MNSTPKAGFLVTCALCGWSCRVSTYGLAIDEARDHEQVCPDCSTEIRPLEVQP